MLYGPRQRPDLAIRKLARLTHNGEPMPVFRNGTMQRDYTCVDDIIQRVRSAIDFRGSHYEIINLGEEPTVELRDLVVSCPWSCAWGERLRSSDSKCSPVMHPSHLQM